MYNTDALTFIFGIFFLWGCFKLYEEYLWFRVLAATFGICVTLLVPIGSLFIAYISLFQEGVLWLAIVQILLGWTIGALMFWFSIGPYIDFIKKTFGKSESSMSKEKKDKLKISKPGRIQLWMNDIQDHKSLLLKNT